MRKTKLLNILIVCVTFSRGIVGTSLEDDVGESSNLLVREKRVINRRPGEDVPLTTGTVPYIVNIRKNTRLHCVGAILSQHTVITAARCVSAELSNYLVMSGSAYTYLTQNHTIRDKKLHGHSPSRAATFLTGIALINVNPSFHFSHTTDEIPLHSEPVLTGMRGTVSGWGAYCYGGPRETVHIKRLRSIIVPIMKHQECVNIYRGVFEIKDEDICTYHPQKQCGYTDAGAPLVIHNQLVGIHIGGIETEGREFLIKPDVFVLLQDSNYRQWIRDNIE